MNVIIAGSEGDEREPSQKNEMGVAFPVLSENAFAAKGAETPQSDEEERCTGNYIPEIWHVQGGPVTCEVVVARVLRYW